MFAVVFPGQGSQKPGMGRDLYENGPSALAVFREVSDAIGRDVASLCFDSDEETLRQTQNAQIALYTCGVAAWKELESRLDGRRPIAMAGHSVGEYAALASAGVLGVSDGAKLVQRRGELMAASGGTRPGTMAAILGLEREELDAVCREASTPASVAVIANDNCPGQLVISGDVDAVRWAGEIASGKGAKRVLPLNVSGAFHSPLMEEAAAEMGNALRQAKFETGSVPVVSNVLAQTPPELVSWPVLLERQLKNPVRWTESVKAMQGMGATTFVECGSGEVLCGLIKRIDREVMCLAANDVASIGLAVEGLATSKAGIGS